MFLAWMFEGVPEADTPKIMSENAAELFGFDRC
jgi:hypothetical protein